MSSSSKLLTHAARQLDRAIMRSIKEHRRTANKARTQQRSAAIKQYKLLEKQQAIEHTADAVRKQEEYIAELKTIHQYATDEINWNEILAGKEPDAPCQSTAYEEEATYRKNIYTPSFFSRMLKLEKRQRRDLEKQIELARRKDESVNNIEKARYDQAFADWKENQDMAKGVLDKSASAYKSVVDYFEPFAELVEFGTRMQLRFTADNISVDLYVNSKDILPIDTLSQTSTGKLSRKTMSESRSNTLYQDFVCSASLRVGREIFACIPIDLVIVNAISTILDTSTGKSAEQAILSIAFIRQRLQSINFDQVEPLAALRNFPHHMKFGKTTGFTIVETIDPATLILT
jgi:hypothetical protein